MPSSCIVCGATKKGNKVKLFHFVVISKNQPNHLQELSKRRRHEWLRVVRKTEDDLKDAKCGTYICSRHFKSGEPAKVRDFTNHDWIPSQNLTPPTIESISKKPDNKRLTQPSKEPDDPARKYQKIAPKTSIGMHSSKSNLKAVEPSPTTNFSATTSDGNKKQQVVTQVEHELIEKERIIVCLRNKLHLHNMSEDSFINDDLKTQFYTGFPTYRSLAAFASSVTHMLPQNDFFGISKTDMLITVLTKLHLNLPLPYMSLKFEIPFGALTEIFITCIRKLAEYLHVTWPPIRKIPTFLKKIFGDQLAAIVDILELPLDYGSGSFNSLKFLIAYSPNGRISFVSKAYKRYSQENWIVEDSGLLNCFTTSDLILALRGTLDEAVVAPGGFRDRVFVYRVVNNGLVRVQWNASDSMDLKMNLGAIMNRLTTVSAYLDNKQPEMLMQDPAEFLNKVVMVCAALSNLMLPV